MQITERRYDIDWIRVIAIGLLIVYHVAIGFQPWGIFIGFIQNTETSESLWVPMSMLNVWRIPLLFFVSGMGVCFAMKRRGIVSLIRERAKRILIPFVFGIVAIVPLHIFIIQAYYDQDLRYVLNPYHLWFLGNIFTYAVVFSPLFYYLKRTQGSKFHLAIEKLFSHPAGLLVAIIPFVLEAVLVNPIDFPTYAMNLHGWILGALAFIFGFLFIYSGKGFWSMIVKWRLVLLAAALTLYLTRLIVNDMVSPHYLMAIESCIWIFTVFAFGHKYLNRGSSALSYLSQAAYPVYILHMIFLYLAAWLLFPLNISLWWKFGLSILVTGVGCVLTYEYLVRRIGFLRPLFGLKPKPKHEPKPIAEPVVEMKSV